MGRPRFALPPDSLERPSYWYAVLYQYPPFYADEIERVARDPRIHVEKELLQALIWQESRFDSAAISRAGAVGLTQLLPKTAREMARRLHERAPADSELFEPRRNIRYGAYQIRLLLDRFHGRVPLALAAYNAGIPAAERWARLAPNADDALLCEMLQYRETENYVKNILATRAAYREIHPVFVP